MKRTRTVLASSIAALALTACGAKGNPSPSEYIGKVEVSASKYAADGGFKVMQLTDIHWSVNTDIEKSKAYLTNMVKVNDPDLIVMSGDAFLVATMEIATSLVETFESWDIPFAFTWGNHDRQGRYTPAWLDRLVSRSPKSLYRNLDDNVYGRSNYAIDLSVEGSERSWRVYAVDSNAYSAGDAFSYDYGYVTDDQVGLFSSLAEESKRGDGTYLPSISFMHIPPQEMCEAYDEAKKAGGYTADVTASIGEVKEKPSGSAGRPIFSSTHESAFVSMGLAHGIKGYFFGHDHSNDIAYTYKGYGIGYGVKSTDDLYYHVGCRGDEKTAMVGCAMYTLKADESYKVEHILYDLDTKDEVNREEMIVL